MINLSKILEEIKNDKKVSELSITEQMEYTIDYTKHPNTMIIKK